MLFIKHLQPLIGAGVIGLAMRTVWAGWLSFNCVDEHAKRSLIVKTFAKVDPGPLSEEGRQFAVVERIRNARKQNRDQPVTRLLRCAILGDKNLFARPISDAVWPDEYCASRTTAEGIHETRLKGFSGNEVPLVQPGFHPGVFQFVRNKLDRRFVGAVMGQENIENCHGRALLRSST